MFTRSYIVSDGGLCTLNELLYVDKICRMCAACLVFRE